MNENQTKISFGEIAESMRKRQFCSTAAFVHKYTIPFLILSASAVDLLALGFQPLLIALRLFATILSVFIGFSYSSKSVKKYPEVPMLSYFMFICCYLVFLHFIGNDPTGAYVSGYIQIKICLLIVPFTRLVFILSELFLLSFLGASLWVLKPEALSSLGFEWWREHIFLFLSFTIIPDIK